MPLPLSLLISRVLVPFAAGYFLSYLYRTVNAVLAPEIGREIALDASSLGLMTGAYFLTFSAFQLPLGLLLDRYGPRRVESALLLIAAAGALAFAWAESTAMLIAGRALIGLGVSACLMAALKANVQFFDPRRIPLVNGLILSAGGLGAVAATAPVQAALAITDWRGIYGIVALLTVAASIFLFVTVPDRQAPNNSVAGKSSFFGQLEEMRAIFSTPLFWRVAPVFTASQGGFLAIQGLWAGPWLRDVACLSADDSAAALTLMAAAMTAGFLLMGVVAERAGRAGIPTSTVAAAGMIVFAISSALLALGWTGAPLLLAIIFGFFGPSGTLLYAVMSQGFPSHMAGRANTSVNLLVFAGAFAFQWGLGAIINLWPETSEGSWPEAAYATAFAVPAVLQAAALVWFIISGRRSSR